MARRTKSAAARPAVPAVPAPLVLPAELTIYSVGELHPQWLAWLTQLPPAVDVGADAAATTVEVQAAAVDQIDAAGVQLLLSLQHALAALGRSLALRDASRVLQDACAALGLAGWLQERHAAAPLTTGAAA
jgi:ABC-type transporter Mla MlaB component